MPHLHPPESMELWAFPPGRPETITNLAAIVRFNSTGTIDARSGGAYTAAARSRTRLALAIISFWM